MLRLWRKTRWLRLRRISRIWIRLKNETVFYLADKKYCKKYGQNNERGFFLDKRTLWRDFTSERGEEQSQL